MSPRIARSEEASTGIPTAREEERRALLSELPVVVGASWARVWCENLRREGRSIDGGWPGTLPEARSRVAQHLEGELRKRGMPLLDPRELERAVAATYERAKFDWLELARGRKLAPLPSSVRGRQR